jgi:hypothetical protein
MLAARPEPCTYTPTDWVAQVEAVLRFHRDMHPNPENRERQ